MDEDEFRYCHNDDTDEYHDCLDYMECEECPYYYADLDQAVEQMIIKQYQKPFVPKYANYDYVKVYDGNDIFIGWIRIYHNLVKVVE